MVKDKWKERVGCGLIEQRLRIEVEEETRLPFEERIRQIEREMETQRFAVACKMHKWINLHKWINEAFAQLGEGSSVRTVQERPGRREVSRGAYR